MNSKVLVFVSVLVIGLGMYGIFFHGGSTSINLTPQKVAQKKGPQKINAIVSRQQMLPGDAITRDKIEIKSLTLADANHAGVSKDIVLDFNQRLFARKIIPAGAFIFPEDTITPDSRDYLDFIVKPNHIPYPLVVEKTAMIGGVIHEGSYIDILALASASQNMAERSSLNNTSFKQLTLTPVLLGIKVLKFTVIGIDKEENKKNKEPEKVALILELTQKQVATLTVARRIALLEVHKSIGSNQEKAEMSANAGDVLEDYKAIKEFRAGEEKIN